MVKFQYVYVPCEAHKAIEEQTHEGVCELGNDSFNEKLKKYFAAGNQAVDRDLLKKQVEAHAKQSIDKAGNDVMDKLMALTTVDIFPVLMPTKDTQFNGISVYVDDKGIAKKLPLNERLTSLIQYAGYKDQIFHGDAFVARIFDDDDAWHRMDFKMSELNGDATWVKQSIEMRVKASQNRGQVQDLQKMMGDVTNKKHIEAKPATGDSENYSWRDVDGEEIEVSFKCSDVTKKDVKVVFTNKRLKVTIKGEDVFDNELFSAIEPSDCTWSVMDKALQVTLMKKSEKQWKTLVNQEIAGTVVAK